MFQHIGRVALLFVGWVLGVPNPLPACSSSSSVGVDLGSSSAKVQAYDSTASTQADIEGLLEAYVYSVVDSLSSISIIEAKRRIGNYLELGADPTSLELPTSAPLWLQIYLSEIRANYRAGYRKYHSRPTIDSGF